VRGANRGETYIPRVPSALITDVAALLIGDRPIETVVTGIRPGEKVHEILVSEEECHRTVDRGQYYAILPMLPEVSGKEAFKAALTSEYSSAENVMTRDVLVEILRRHHLMVDDNLLLDGELLR
jgi:UDP-glucose 4-epimerase